jgi:inorganic pyrophosphatase
MPYALPSSSFPGHLGDNDPLDAIEIGTRQWAVGALVRVKVLGALAMIDNGEADWKLIAISTEDPLAAKVGCMCVVCARR